MSMTLAAVEPCVAAASATLHFDILLPLPWLLSWPCSPRHRPGSSSSSASLLVVFSLTADVWAFHMERSPFLANLLMSWLVIQFPSQRSLLSISLSWSFSLPLPGILLLGTTLREEYGALTRLQIPPICLPDEWSWWVSSCFHEWGSGFLTPVRA